MGRTSRLNSIFSGIALAAYNPLAAPMAARQMAGHKENGFINKGTDMGLDAVLALELRTLAPSINAPVRRSLSPVRAPLYEGDKVINPDLSHRDMEQLTTQYTEHAVSFIERNKAKPFFLYVAHTMPRVPLAVSERFRGNSKRGLYGDAVEEAGGRQIIDRPEPQLIGSVP
jgi:hypothetical protein